MPQTRPLQTSWSKGELSPLLEGHSDIAGYFEGAAELENWQIIRQGGIRRWYGSRFIKEVKDSTQEAILWPFEFSVDDAYILEVGNLYIRVYKDKAPVLNAGTHVEIVTPFVAADIRSIHFTQSADIVFTFHAGYQQRKLSRVSDTSWSLSLFNASPPPSFEADTDISGGSATLTPAATTGSAITFTASAAVFLNADVGRQIIFGASRAIIVTFTDTSHVNADILDAFPNTSAIPAGSWLLRLSPQTSLDPTIARPVGAQVTLAAGVATFRSADVGKYINVYSGIVKITNVDSTTSVRGTIMSEMGDVPTTTANPAAAASGAWTLEEASWSASRGYPRTGEFFQGRLYQESSTAQKTTFWGSRSDDYENYAVGITAQDAVEYTVASRQVNRLEWIAENNRALFLGTSGSEIKATGSGTDFALIGGDTIPQIDRLATNGCAPIQPIVARKSILYIDRSRRKVMLLGYDLDSDGETDKEISVGSQHITESGVLLGPMAFERRLDPRLYFCREDGVLVAMTFFPEQKIVAFSRRTTDGMFESVAAIPNADGGADQVWVIVRRLVNGVLKRFVEMFEYDHEDLADRPWTSLQTDAAIVYNGVATTTIPVPHLVGATVDVIADSGYRGQKVVDSYGNIALDEEASVVEAGLHYDSTAVSMRPSLQGTNIQGIVRGWISLFVRLFESKGGTLNGQALNYKQTNMDQQTLFTGDVKASGSGVDREGRFTIEQTQPYPMTVLCTFGTLDIGDLD
jgi:hypothetical protein